MKLAAILILGLLLLIDAANSVPMVEPEGAPVSTEEVPEGDNMPLDTELLDDMPLDTELLEENKTIQMDEEGAPSDRYLEEVREYFQHQKSEKSLRREARHSGGTIMQGDTIALQTYERPRWLSCYGSHCNRQTCPRMYMTGSDWSNCWGEVFKIYRASGPGTVLVGDLVGLYYPREGGTWMGCPGYNCGKSTCPGYPTIANGFASQDHWYRCWGEVFRIYARGKSSGAVINSYDDVVLYYVQQGVWVAQGPDRHTEKLPCLGTSRPPPLSVYDRCAWETFTIWKRE